MVFQLGKLHILNYQQSFKVLNNLVTVLGHKLEGSGVLLQNVVNISKGNGKVSGSSSN